MDNIILVPGEFLSTLSLRRATVQIIVVVMYALFLSTLSLRRATWPTKRRLKSLKISIHALLAESDDKNECTSLAPKPFLSTLSLRRATYVLV